MGTGTEYLHLPRRWCEVHGKFAYFTKPDAKAAIKRFHRQERAHMRAYPCSEGEYFHIGRLPQAVINGTMTEDEWWNSVGRYKEQNRFKRMIYQTRNPNRVKPADLGQDPPEICVD
jgi:hypothetical protein